MGKLKIILFFIFLNKFCGYSQQVSDSLPPLKLYFTEENINYFNALPWNFSPVVSLGAGSPNGIQAEVGQNIGAHLAIGAVFTTLDSWSRNNQSIKPGFFVSLKIPYIEFKKFVPYFTYRSGRTFENTIAHDSYQQFTGGWMYQISNPINIRAEIGGIFTQRYISGGNELYGGYQAEIFEVKSFLLFNLSLEINFRGGYKDQ